ncbi:uncharacterized protein [Branchiostoma lanceolatum]|uniref:uncharacterized protein isoform X2 n=1 Tax=Branchiostoma lanceolatum TaxID=7740 RepID=UPI0034555545
MASFNPFKHLKPQDREVRSSGDLHEMYKKMAAMIDLSHLSEEEKEKILQVLQRDEDLRKVEERRITRRKSELGSELEDADSKLKHEFQEVKKKSAVKPAEAQNSDKNCSRCQTAFGFFFDTGNPCPQCQHKVCNSCREFITPKKDKWLCALCNKQRLLKIETGEWFYETMDPKKKDLLFGTDLIRASLRRPRGRGRGRGRPQPVGDQIKPALTGSRERVQDVGRSPGRGRDRTAQHSPRRDGKTDPHSQNHLAPEESHTNFYRKIAEIDNGPALPARSSASLPRDTMMSRTSPRVSSDSGRSSPLLVGSNRNPSKPVPLNRRIQPSRKQMSLDDELHLVCAEEEKKTSRYHDVAFPKKSDTELLDELVSAGDYSTSESLVRRYSSDSTASYSSGPSSPQMSVRAWLNAQEAGPVHTTTDVPTPTTASETNSLQNFEDVPDNRPSNWNGSTNRDDLPLDPARGEYIDDGRSSTGHGHVQHHKEGSSTSSDNSETDVEQELSELLSEGQLLTPSLTAYPFGGAYSDPKSISPVHSLDNTVTAQSFDPVHFQSLDDQSKAGGLSLMPVSQDKVKHKRKGVASLPSTNVEESSLGGGRRSPSLSTPIPSRSGRYPRLQDMRSKILPERLPGAYEKPPPSPRINLQFGLQKLEEQKDMELKKKASERHSSAESAGSNQSNLEVDVPNIPEGEGAIVYPTVKSSNLLVTPKIRFSSSKSKSTENIGQQDKEETDNVNVMRPVVSSPDVTTLGLNNNDKVDQSVVERPENPISNAEREREEELENIPDRGRIPAKREYYSLVFDQDESKGAANAAGTSRDIWADVPRGSVSDASLSTIQEESEFEDPYAASCSSLDLPQGEVFADESKEEVRRKPYGARFGFRTIVEPDPWMDTVPRSRDSGQTPGGIRPNMSTNRECRQNAISATVDEPTFSKTVFRPLYCEPPSDVMEKTNSSAKKLSSINLTTESQSAIETSTGSTDESFEVLSPKEMSSSRIKCADEDFNDNIADEDFNDNIADEDFNDNIADEDFNDNIADKTNFEGKTDYIQKLPCDSENVAELVEEVNETRLRHHKETDPCSLSEVHLADHDLRDDLETNTDPETSTVVNKIETPHIEMETSQEQPENTPVKEETLCHLREDTPVDMNAAQGGHQKTLADCDASDSYIMTEPIEFHSDTLMEEELSGSLVVAEKGSESSYCANKVTAPSLDATEDVAEQIEPESDGNKTLSVESHDASLMVDVSATDELTWTIKRRPCSLNEGFLVGDNTFVELREEMNSDDHVKEGLTHSSFVEPHGEQAAEVELPHNKVPLTSEATLLTVKEAEVFSPEPDVNTLQQVLHEDDTEVDVDESLMHSVPHEVHTPAVFVHTMTGNDGLDLNEENLCSVEEAVESGCIPLKEMEKKSDLNSDVEEGHRESQPCELCSTTLLAEDIVDKSESDADVDISAYQVVVEERDLESSTGSVYVSTESYFVQTPSYETAPEESVYYDQVAEPAVTVVTIADTIADEKDNCTDNTPQTEKRSCPVPRPDSPVVCVETIFPSRKRQPAKSESDPEKKKRFSFSNLRHSFKRSGRDTGSHASPNLLSKHKRSTSAPSTLPLMPPAPLDLSDALSSDTGSSPLCSPVFERFFLSLGTGMEVDGGSYRDPQHSGTESSTPYRVKAEKDQRNRHRVKSTHEEDPYASPAKKTGRGGAVGKPYRRYPSSTSGSELFEVTPLSKSQMADSPQYFDANGHRRFLEKIDLPSESEVDDPYAADSPAPQRSVVKKRLPVEVDLVSESEVEDPYAAESPNPVTPSVDKGVSLDTSAWSDTPEALSPESTYLSRSLQSDTESNISRRSRTPRGARKQVFRRLISRTPSGRLKDSPALLEAYTQLTQSRGRCKSFSGLSDWSFDSYPASEVGAASEPGGLYHHSSRSTLTSSREAVRQSRTRSLDRSQALRHRVSPPISPTNTRPYRTASEEELGRPTLYADEPDRRAINATLPQGTRAEVDVHHHNEDRASRAHGTPPAKNRSIPTVAVEDSKEITRYPSSRDLGEFEDEDIDAYVRQYGSGSDKSASGSQRGSSLGASMSGSRESIMSYYSDAGDGYYGNIEITGDILLSLDYNFKNMVLAVNIKKCRDLAVADDKKKKSDPYVKTYLLPDKTKSGKRKTKVKKHTIKPTYDEVLKYSISPSELETRTLWASVWHNDMFGRNTFLGEVHLPLDNWDWDDRQARWYQLQMPVVPAGPKSTFQQYKGDLVISMKYVPSYKLLGGGGDTSRKGRRKGSPDRSSGEAGMGELHVFIKEARNLMAVRANGSSDPFVKGYLLPDKSKQSKQKTPYIKRNCNPTWNHTFVYKSVNPEELEQRCLELTVWDYDRMTSNDFLGGVRLSLGRVHAKTLVNLNASSEGNRLGQPIEWMDSQGEEITAWRTMLNKPNVWVDSCLLLRPSMDYRIRPSTPAPSTTS